MLARSLSIIVPALNEEENIALVLDGLVKAFAGADFEYEILVFDDGSRDFTYSIAAAYSLKNKQVRVFKNHANRGIGYCFKRGIEESRYGYLTFYPADNQNYPQDPYRLASHMGTCPVIIALPHYKPGERSLFRRVLSKCVTRIFTSFIPYKLAHVTNMVFYSRDSARSFKIRCDGFMFQIEALLKALRVAPSIIISRNPVKVRPRAHGQTKAIRFKTLAELFYLFFLLLVEFYFTRRQDFCRRQKVETFYV